MRTKTYVLLGEPVSWQRPHRNGSRVYDGQKHVKLVTGIALKNQHDDEPLFTGPLILDITFFMPIPKTSEKRRKLLFNTPHFSKPDYSNLLKILEDVATGIIFTDDRIIAKVIGSKLYEDGNGPRTVFTISEWK